MFSTTRFIVGGVSIFARHIFVFSSTRLFVGGFNIFIKLVFTDAALVSLSHSELSSLILIWL